jgi:hypothetical protein
LNDPFIAFFYTGKLGGVFGRGLVDVEVVLVCGAGDWVGELIGLVWEVFWFL